MSHDYDISISEGVEVPISQDEIIADCNLVLEQEGVSRPCMVSISVVRDDEIRAINRTWRQKDAITDVISLETERPDDPDLMPGEPCELGDIVLAPCYISRQATDFHTTPADEFRLMLVHAMLHLLGYDHLEDAQAEVMEAREDELVALIVTDRPFTPVTLTRHREGTDE